MMPAPISHRIYTQAENEPRIAGARYWPLGDREGPSIPADITVSLDSMISMLAPLGEGPAWLSQRFGAGPDTVLCLIVSHAGLVSDASDRAALINHAQLIRVPLDGDWLDLDALIDLAASISLTSVSSASDSRHGVEAYVDQLKQEVEIQERDPAHLASEERDRLFDLASLLVSTVSRGKESAIGGSVVSSVEAARRIAAAWSGLPLGLQIRAPWTLDAQNATGDSIRFRRNGGQVEAGSAKVRNVVRRYFDLRIAAAPEIQSLIHDVRRGTFTDLQFAVGEAEEQRAQAGAPAPPEDTPTSNGRHEGHMSNPKPRPTLKETSPVSNDHSDAATAALAELLSDEARAIEGRLNEWVEQRLNLFVNARRMGPRQSTSADGESEAPDTVEPKRESWMWWRREDGWLLILLIPLVLAYYLLGTNTPPPPLAPEADSRMSLLQRQVTKLRRDVARLNALGVNGANPQAASNLPPPVPAPSASLPWRDQLLDVMVKHRAELTPLTNELLASGLASGKAAVDLERIAGEADLEGPDKHADRIRLRALLFEYVARVKCAKCNKNLTDSIVIGGDPTDITGPIRKDLKDSLGMKSPPVLSEEFMAEAVYKAVRP